ncbi:type II secretion system protein [bacterium]|nr:type II secretion system protein [bacterium]
MTNKHAINKQFTTHYSLITNFAFTLAETLIVMGIIGVVAALTLPNLNSSTGDKEKVAKLQKIYSNLNDAYGRATAIYGPLSDWGLTDNHEKDCKKIGERLTEFMKISKSCGYYTEDSAPSCISQTVKKIGDTTGSGPNNIGYTYILADGTGMAIEGDKDGLYIGVDIDGPNKGRQMFGVDMFEFTTLTDKPENGIIPDSQDNIAACIGSKGVLCTAWVIQNGNMDYLKANDAGKCNNSNVTLSATNMTCK